MKDLAWAPNSYYRLRDSHLAARIDAVEADRLEGRVFPSTKVQWINGEPWVDPADGEGATWDLRGDSTEDRGRDLIELLR